MFGSPYKAVQFGDTCSVLACKHLILRQVLSAVTICNMLKLLTCIVL